MSAWTTSPLVVGHRGGRGRPRASDRKSYTSDWPAENTLEAFDRARSEGARAVELDVRMCRGGEAVVFHDPTLARMTLSRDLRPVHDVAIEGLRNVDLGAGARVPLLAEVLAWARERGVAVNVEMKHDVPGRAQLVRATVRAVRFALADVLLSSFDPLMLGMAALLAPSIPRALLTYAEQPLWAHLVERASRRPFVQAVHVERTQMAEGLAAACARRGLRVGVWTVNDPDEASEFIQRGAATIITDVPGEMICQIDGQRSATQR